MSSTMRRWAATAAVLVPLAAPAGCAEPTAPGEAAPRLAQIMTRVDDAVAAQNWVMARNALQRMIDQAAAAFGAGTITEAESIRIQAAALRLLAVLPKPAAVTTAVPAPTTESHNAPATQPYQLPSDDPEADPGEAPDMTTRDEGTKPAEEERQTVDVEPPKVQDERAEAEKERKKSAEEEREKAEDEREKAEEEREKAEDERKAEENADKD